MSFLTPLYYHFDIYLFSSQIVKVALQNMKSSNFGDISISRAELMHRTPSDSRVNNAKLTFRGMKQ